MGYTFFTRFTRESPFGVPDVRAGGLHVSRRQIRLNEGANRTAIALYPIDTAPYPSDARPTCLRQMKAAAVSGHDRSHDNFSSWGMT